MSPTDMDRQNLPLPAAPQATEQQKEVILAAWQDEGQHMEQVLLPGGEIVVRRHGDDKVLIEV